MYDDSLYRVSFKCVIENEKKELLVVKEKGRASWDIPGGGIEHGETIEESIRRELYEEVGFKGTFTYSILMIHDPVKLLTRDVWQLKIVIRVETDDYIFAIGKEADDVMFVDPARYADSEHESEHRLIDYMRSM